MEKRTLIAALAAGLFLVLWYSLFSPHPAPPAPGTAPQVGATAGVPQATPGAGAESSPTEAPAAAPAAEEANAPAVERGAAAQVVELEGGRWKGTLSSAGGVITSLVLNGYESSGGGPLELVSADRPRPLQIATPGPWNEENYVVDREGETVRLRWSDGRGNWVEKIVTPAQGQYGLAISVKAGGIPARAGVVVAASLPAEGSTKTRGFGRIDGLVRLNGKLERINPAKLDEKKAFDGAIEFAGVEDQYFLLVLLPDGGQQEMRVEPAAHEGLDVVAMGVAGEVHGTLVGMPKEHDLLVAYGRGLADTQSFGLFGFLSVVFLGVLRWIHGFVGNWGVAIIVLTAAIRVLLFPLTHKSTVSMRRMQKLQPKMKAIQGRYKERAKKDPQVRQRMNQEIMGLYKQEGVNPMGGCLPTIVQLPILWALYTLFAYAIELRHAPFMLWITDLSVKDPTYVLPILMTASMFLQQKISPQMGDPSQRRLFMMMPLIFGFMFMNFPAGLVLYWLTNNVLTIAQQLVTERILKGQAARA